MTDDFTELERELKQLRPRAVPAPLLGRVAEKLAAPRPASQRRSFLADWRAWILPASTAALLAVTVTSIPFLVRERAAEIGMDTVPVPAITTSANSEATATAAPGRLQPVRATNVLLSAVNEGVVYLDDDTPAQRMRLNYLDTITWQDPRSGASLQRTVPREEIYFVPVTAN